VHQLWQNETLIFCLVLVLKVFLHHSRVAKVTLDKIQKVMHYKSATKGAKLHRIDFNEECKSTFHQEGYIP
jgi:hypothetical protein